MRARLAAGGAALALTACLALLADPARGLGEPSSPLELGLPPEQSRALEELSLLPEATRRAVLRVARHPAGLARLGGLARSGLEGEAARRLDAVTADYPPESREAFAEVLAQPRLLESLLENFAVVVALGAAYRGDPVGTGQGFAELGRRVEEERAEAAAREEQERRAAEARAAEEEAEREARRLWRSVDPWWTGYGPAWGLGFAYGPDPYWYGPAWRWGTWGWRGHHHRYGHRGHVRHHGRHSGQHPGPHRGQGRARGG
jgi:hypothetical protein